ncbi:hypothetical protein BDM02DRAFT_3114837 [Thelephora ganbajun]|uniref:Uncharacterized protein n=1 Tax=Thelephora ganbajun TaxID=370292 RepID=A0ACB6ZGW6_THEGA|nr:hypothetical protein BDM02DRAFT_3114837 [Thelephora ganbajun]
MTLSSFVSSLVPSRGNQTPSMSVPVPSHILGSKYTSTLSAPYLYTGFLLFLPLPLPLDPPPPKSRSPVSSTSSSSGRSFFLVPKIMNWSKTIMRVRKVSPMIPTTKMTAESRTGN